MSVLLRYIARYLAQKAASDPRVREKVLKAARGVVEKAEKIANENDRAYAAGRAFRRAFDKLQSTENSEADFQEHRQQDVRNGAKNHSAAIHTDLSEPPQIDRS